MRRANPKLPGTGAGADVSRSAFKQLDEKFVSNESKQIFNASLSHLLVDSAYGVLVEMR